MAKANLSGLTAATTSETSSKIILRAMEPTHGATNVSTPETGRTIRWRALALLRGPMAVVTPVTTLTTRKRVKVSSTGPMAANTTVNGSTESRMALALTHLLRAKLREANGAMESVLTGSPKNEKENVMRYYSTIQQNFKIHW
jgi:hypothetical protein